MGLGRLVALGWLISGLLAAVDFGWVMLGARQAGEGEKWRSNAENQIYLLLCQEEAGSD